MADPMTLGELIAALEAEDLRTVVREGFGTPHSYRGYYEDVAFEPARNVTVAQMLGAAREALGSTFEGYKGGEYTMREDTDCWIATWGACGSELSLQRLRDMLAAGHAQDGQAAEVDRLRAELDDAAHTRRRVERERDQMTQRVEQGRRAAVVYVERIQEAEAERDRLAEQVRVLAEKFKRTGTQARCSAHPDHADPDCETCRDVGIFRAALDGTEADT